jgi:hypothetical protein
MNGLINWVVIINKNNHSGNSREFKTGRRESDVFICVGTIEFATK